MFSHKRTPTLMQDALDLYRTRCGIFRLFFALHYVIKETGGWQLLCVPDYNCLSSPNQGT
jgi:hypothetical protein